MTCAEELQAALNQREGLLVLARHIDAIQAKLDAAPTTAHDGWGEWSPAPAPVVYEPWNDPKHPANREYEADRVRKVADLRAKLDATTDGEDRRALEAQLRLAEEKGHPLLEVVPEGRREIVEVTDNEIIINSPAPTPERREARRKWATGRDVHTFFPEWKDNPEGFVDVYVKGGPLWMYHGDRDAVMQMPVEWRKDMVQDILQDSPATAQEIGRDLLRADAEAQREWAYGA